MLYITHVTGDREEFWGVRDCKVMQGDSGKLGINSCFKGCNQNSSLHPSFPLRYSQPVTKRERGPQLGDR